MAAPSFHTAWTRSRPPGTATDVRLYAGLVAGRGPGKVSRIQCFRVPFSKCAQMYNRAFTSVY
jgi:hypothetical protein